MELLTDPPPHAPSLAERVRLFVSSGDSAGSGWKAGVVVGVLLAAAPSLTWAGARVLEARVRADSAAILRAAQPRLASGRMVAAGRETLATVLRRPGIGATLEAIARALPAEASLVRAERAADGRLSIDVAAPDPDRVRAALRREPLTDDLRNVAQRAGDGAMVVTFESGR